METTLIKSNGVGLEISDKDIENLIEAGIIPMGTPSAQVKIFATVCKEKNLSPFSKQIHLIKRATQNGDRYTAQTSIDGYRVIAERTRTYVGSSDYLFDDGKTQFEMIEAGKKIPTTATATVKKKINGETFEYSATAQWSAYYPGEKLGFMWQKMPFLMLGKCAEALALRKAFPTELHGVYVSEEMAQVEYSNETGNINAIDTEDAINKIALCNSFDDLVKIWESNKNLQSDITFLQAMTNRKNEIKKAKA